MCWSQNSQFRLKGTLLWPCGSHRPAYMIVYLNLGENNVNIFNNILIPLIMFLQLELTISVSLLCCPVSMLSLRPRWSVWVRGGDRRCLTSWSAPHPCYPHFELKNIVLKIISFFCKKKKLFKYPEKIFFNLWKFKSKQRLPSECHLCLVKRAQSRLGSQPSYSLARVHLEFLTFWTPTNYWPGPWRLSYGFLSAVLDQLTS